MKNKNKTTKFPVARIKRIMQKDEEVGKVAQATPIVISKALELFLAMIVDEAAKVTTERGSKKVEAYHLKHAVDTVEMLDFLKEIVQEVPDPSAGGTIDLDAENDGKRRRGKGKAKATTGSEENGENGASGSAAPKRKRKTKKEVQEERARADKERGKPKDEDDYDQMDTAETEKEDEDDWDG